LTKNQAIEKRKKVLGSFSFFIFLCFQFPSFAEANFFSKGEKLFEANCSVCHPNGKNFILPEKSLEKENLEANGMNSVASISYQVRNGKNGMPAFGDRLTKEEIESLADFILFHSEKNFEKD
jgi:cytochrome c6